MAERDLPKSRQPKAACPTCGHWDSLVTQGYAHPAGYTRRRKCLACHTTYKTREVLILAKVRISSS